MVGVRGQQSRPRISFQLAFSPDSELLAQASFQDRLNLWRVRDGAWLWSFAGPAADEPVSSVAFSPDGAYLAAGSGDQSLRIWRTSDVALLATLSFNAPVRTVAFDPRGRRVAIGLWDGTVRLWRFEPGRG